MRLQPIKIWNSDDEFGLTVGLGRWSPDKESLEAVRLPAETNKELRERTKRATKYLGNSTIQGMVNNISRDLGVSISGGGLLPWYNTEDRKIFYLSESPYPGPSGVRVYISTSGSWSDQEEVIPQIRASGYTDAVSGWIVWNLPDYDPSVIADGLVGSSGWYSTMGISGFSDATRYGEYTRILEFLGNSYPQSDEAVRIDYLVKTGMDDLGVDILNWRSDFRHPDMGWDTRYGGQRSEIPTTSGAFIDFVTSGYIAVYSAYDIITGPVSGYYYDTNGKATEKLLKLQKLVNDATPLTWDKFKYDIGRWDQLERSSLGCVPSFHDATLPDSTTAVDYYNGIHHGIDLDMVGVEMVGSGSLDEWYPKFEPGDFYIGQERYHLFAKLRFENMTLLPVAGGIMSGTLVYTGDDRPREFDTIAACTSGRYYQDTLQDNPYIKRVHDFSSPLSGVYYRAAFCDNGSGIVPADIPFDNGYAFYYDYDSGCVFTSGCVEPTGFILFWEDSSVDVSGVYVVFSGGYGFSTPNLNPLVSPEDKIYAISDA